VQEVDMSNRATTPTKLTGTFEVGSWEETAYRERDGEPRLTHVVGTQQFTGQIEGEGTIAWLMCYRPDGTARFVGMQHIAGTFDGRQGSIVIESIGEHDGTASTGAWTVVEGSGTGSVGGVTGHGRFTAPGGKVVRYELELD
jgi:hypothetical protein